MIPMNFGFQAACVMPHGEVHAFEIARVSVHMYARKMLMLTSN